MYKEIDDFIKSCKICSTAGERRVNTKNRIIQTSQPNELWEVDLIGRLMTGNKQNKFIFVAVDHYTKWVETGILQEKNASSVAKLVKDLIIRKHGIPKTILSNNGLEFSNKAITSLKEKYNFDWKYASPGHHKTVGAVERVNQSLMRKLKKLTEFGIKSWEVLLPKATFALNISFNRSISTFPYIFKEKNCHC